MRTCVELVGDSGDAERIRELGELFVALRDQGDGDYRRGLALVPRWLSDAFAPERTMEEAEAWLARWRAAPDKLAFERESGWTASNWFHWFSSENEFWQLGDIRVDEDGHHVVICLDHGDDPIPVEALKWLAIVGRLRVETIVRVE